MGSFKDFMLQAAPSWLLRPNGQAWMRGLGDGKDAALAKLKEATKVRFLRHAADDALTEIGIERQLQRARHDTPETYRARLLNAWELWPWAGTAYGVLGALYDQGYTNAQLVVAKGRIYTMDGSRQLVTTDTPAGAFTFDPPTMWNKFLLYFGNPAIPRWISEGVTGDEIVAIIALVKKWKPAHAYFDRLVIQSAGATWGLPPSQTWGEAALVWGGIVNTYYVSN